MRQSSSFRPAAGDKIAAAEVAGGTVPGSVRGVVDQPIDMVGLLAGAHDPAAGAVVLFSGEVRDSNRGRAVRFLEYEAQVPLAEKMIAGILGEAKEKWGLSIAIAQHRIGRVEIGETAVVVITAAVHRGEAYAANRYIIDRIKHEAPIWKCEYYSDGTKEWGNNCHCGEVKEDV